VHRAIQIRKPYQKTLFSFLIAATEPYHSYTAVKIGFVLYDYYPFGGLQEDCQATTLTVAERGHEVHIFTRTWTSGPPKEIEIHLLGKKKLE
jgi:hypothetical protein